MMSLALWCGSFSAWAQVPTVSAFTPATGKAGTSVKVTGTGFTTAKSLTFNTVQAVFFIESDTVIYTTVPEGALSGPIGVNNTTGAGASVALFTVAPRIGVLTPDRGLSGRTVVINGANLANTTNVYFGGIAAGFTPISDTQISATVPPGATNAPVTVLTTVGAAVTTNDFLITDVPIIRSFTPEVASVGTLVIIDGGDFTGVTNVLFNGQPATGFAITAQNQVQAQIPATATTGPIKVQTPGGEAVSTNNLITGAGPIITGFSPAAGPVGKRVTITGTGFTGLNSVHFNTNAAISGGVTSDTLAFADVPAGATTGPIKFTKGTNVFITSSNFIVGAFPIITNFTPGNGTAGTQITIQGENLLSVTSVRFGSIPASFFQATADNLMFANVPANATNAPIYLANSSFTNASSTVFIVNGAAPTIVDFTPKSGPPGAIVTLYGYGFSGMSSVTLNGQAVAATVTSVSGTNQISATLPGDASTGTFAVTTPGGTGTSTNSFYVWPHIASFGPVKTTALSSLVLTGANFTATMEVRIGEVVVPPQFVNVENNNRLSLFVPEETVTGPITIKTPAGLMTTITNFGMLPKINALTPDRGRAGDAVSISGSGFFNVTSVKFNGVTAAFTNNSVNLITATVPAGVSPGAVEVITGEGTAVSAQTFLVFPTVTDFSPKKGPYGTAVVLQGIDFLGVTNITLSAVNVPFTVDSATQITATIPVAMSGNLRLYNPAGIMQVSEVFTVQPQMQALRTEEGDLILLWPVDVPVFRLQYTESLTPPVTWVEANLTIITVGNLRTVTITPGSAGERYYRLIFEYPE